jgi:hypothetical protein
MNRKAAISKPKTGIPSAVGMVSAALPLSQDSSKPSQGVQSQLMRPIVPLDSPKRK